MPRRLIDANRVTDDRNAPLPQVALQRRSPWRIVLGGVAFSLAVPAIFFAGQMPRVIPGGPFISIIGDVLPFLAALAAIVFGFVCLRASGTAPKLIAIIAITIATVAIAQVIRDVYSFWQYPYARGDLFGI